MDSPNYKDIAVRILKIAGVDILKDADALTSQEAIERGTMVKEIIEELIAVRENKQTGDPDVLYAVLGSTDGRGYDRLLALFTKREDAEHLRSAWPYREDFVFVSHARSETEAPNPLRVAEVRRNETSNVVWPLTWQGQSQFAVKLVAESALPGFAGLSYTERCDRRIYRNWDEFLYDAQIPLRHVLKEETGNG